MKHQGKTAQDWTLRSVFESRLGCLSASEGVYFTILMNIIDIIVGHTTAGAMHGSR